MEVLVAVKKLDFYLQENCQVKKGYKHWNNTGCYVKGSLKGSMAEDKETCQQSVQESILNMVSDFTQ